ncbi:MAG: DUF4124 domain-containing protein [Parashewanella sp.]
MMKYLFSFSLLWFAFTPTSNANTIYKCFKNNKVVFTQVVCPVDYRQVKVEYHYGVTTETELSDNNNKIDPLAKLLNLFNERTVPKEKLLALLQAEVNRLTLENDYYDILRKSEIQKLDRQRFFADLPESNPKYQAKLKQVNQHFDEMKVLNDDTIQLLKKRTEYIKVETIE